MLILAWCCQINRIMGVYEDAHASFGGIRYLGFQPNLLFRLGGQSAVNNLRIDHKEPAVPMIEGLIIRTEVFLPKCDVIVTGDGASTPGDRLFADIMVAWHEVQRMA